MSRGLGLALPVALGIGVLSGCGLGESSSDVAGTMTETTTETGQSTTETGESTSETGGSTTETGESTSETGESTSETGESTSDTGESTTETGETTTSSSVPLVPCPGELMAADIDESIAVFARADAPPGGDGTRQAPFASLQAAVDVASGSPGKKVFACAGAPFVENVTISAPIEVWGGFGCDPEWVYDPAGRSILQGAEDVVALVLTSGASGAFVVGWQVEAPDAVAPGASSIAVAIHDIAGQASLCRCDLFTGNGSAGTDAAAWVGVAKSGVDAAMSGASDACVDPSAVIGGAPGVVQCDVGFSAGGAGGKGGLPPGGSGQQGGTGQPDYGFPWGAGGKGSMPAACGPGMDALTVPQPQAANGAGGNGSGMLGPSGVKNVDGKPGAIGLHGQGGGGGGGGAAALICPSGLPGVGASGGGGGSGGCGGKGGLAGTAGGSSIGLIVRAGEILLDTVTITTGDGGNGGNGAVGQNGGQGGTVGGPPGGNDSNTPAAYACAGGKGGPGGKGGTGGGGQGGDSVAMAAVMSPGKIKTIAFSYLVGNTGKGGNMIAGYPSETKGGSGEKGEIRIFPAGP
jgi:hypothetical protein